MSDILSLSHSHSFKYVVGKKKYIYIFINLFIEKVTGGRGGMGEVKLLMSPWSG